MLGSEYTPQPLDTSSIELPPTLHRLLEVLARNTHEVWAAARVAEGWTYGPQRDDSRKTHPGLVPYERLSEGEKQYDRNTSAQTLKAILLLGYGITEPSHSGDAAPSA